MSIVLHISAESGFLRARAIGEFSLEEATRTFTEMIEAVARTKLDKVLFDGRGLEGNPQLMERFYYGEFAARTVTSSLHRGACAAPKFAYLLRVPIRDPGSFGENVAVNRGMLVQTFDNVDDALGWLGIASANHPGH